jgi:DNA-binding transcriptional LysR family regulator
VPDLRAVRRAVELGRGVSVLPDYLCESAVAEGRLSIAHAPEEPVTNDLWWVTPRRAHPSSKLSALFDTFRRHA